MEKVEIKDHHFRHWKDLIKPKGLETDSKSLSDTYGRFFIRPLEKGYGLTLGNALRRVLLNSMMGSAISAVKIEGVVHEFSTLPGVLEDVTDIILNLKQVRFSQDDDKDQFLKISKKGPGKVTAQDIETNNNIRVLNPDQPIATLGEEATQFEAEILVTFDRGYVQAYHKSKNLPVGYIGLDAIHSPIRRVNYSVNSARVGQRTDYDALTLELWTDGSITPHEAIPLGYKILKDQFQIFINFNEDKETVAPAKMEEKYKFDDNLFVLVEDLELSVRSSNCLKNARIRLIGDLVTKSEQEMLKTQNFGRKSLNEIKSVLGSMNLTLGMNIEGWPPKDLATRIKTEDKRWKPAENSSSHNSKTDSASLVESSEGSSEYMSFDGEEESEEKQSKESASDESSQDGDGSQEEH